MVRAKGTETIEAVAICAKSRVVKTVGTPLPPAAAHWRTQKVATEGPACRRPLGRDCSRYPSKA